jgi:cytoskeletal protein RodZ
MGKRVLIIVVVLLGALFLYMHYHGYDSQRAGASGDVFSSDSGSLRTDKKDTTSSSSADSPAPSRQPAAADTTPTVPDDGRPQATATSSPAAASAPASDSINPNPPNGMVFSGTGKYQLYRQGNITWRLNTDTGQSCIIFATDEEWKKPKVYRAGCGSR